MPNFGPDLGRARSGGTRVRFPRWRARPGEAVSSPTLLLFSPTAFVTRYPRARWSASHHRSYVKAFARLKKITYPSEIRTHLGEMWSSRSHLRLRSFVPLVMLFYLVAKT